MPINNYSTYLKELKFLYAKYGKLITDIKLQEFIDKEELYENFQITLADVKSDYADINDSEIRMNQKHEPIKYTTSNTKSVESKPKEENIPKCPTCGSTNIEKISTSKKVGGAMLFGLLSSDVRNMMHCKNCGYKW